MSARNMTRCAENFGLTPCPCAGSGVHTWLLASANRLVNRGALTEKSAEEAEKFLTDLMSRRPQPPCEVREAIRRALQDAGKRWASTHVAAPSFDLRVAQAFAGDHQGALEELKARSPVSCNVGTADFLRALFSPGDCVCIANAPMAGGTIWKLGQGSKLPGFPVFPHGVWFTCNSVLGRSVLNKSGKLSVRCADAIQEGRYILLEIDRPEINTDMQAAIIGRLRLPIVSVVSSGGKSLHALARISDGCKERWKQACLHIRAKLPEIGFDPMAMTIERLTRLPGYPRREKGPDAHQELLYLNPDATDPCSIFEKGAQ